MKDKLLKNRKSCHVCGKDKKFTYCRGLCRTCYESARIYNLIKYDDLLMYEKLKEIKNGIKSDIKELPNFSFDMGVDVDLSGNNNEGVIYHGGGIDIINKNNQEDFNNIKEVVYSSLSNIFGYLSRYFLLKGVCENLSGSDDNDK